MQHRFHVPAAAAIAALALCPLPAPAQEVILGFGAALYNVTGDDPTPAQIELELHGASMGAILGWDFGLAAAVMLHDNGDRWVGVGVAGTYAFGEDWFVEASVMPGYYHAGTALTELGSDLEFRLLAGVGRDLGGGLGLSMAVSHLSNANSGDFNSGMNALTLRLHRAF